MKDTNYQRIVWGAIVVCALIMGSCNGAKADVITEFGMGWRSPNTSLVLQPYCSQVAVPDYLRNDPTGRHYGRLDASCGGDNPAFIGWPVAWESDWRGSFRYRVGWFHYSNWFDGGRYLPGGDRHETHMDLLAGTITFNWSKWREQRQKRKN